ncbi:hypothetical protein Tco_1217228 [Tanacetum coccineum]
MDLPDVDLPKYHLIKDAKGIWDAIKTDMVGYAASKRNAKKSSLNMAFVSEEITSSTDELSTAYHVNSATGQSNKAHGSSSYVNEVDSVKFVDMDLKLGCGYDIHKVLTSSTIRQGRKKAAVDRKRKEESGIQGISTYDWSYLAAKDGTNTRLCSYGQSLLQNLQASDSLYTGANLESVAYELGLKSVEAQLVQYQKNEVILEEKIGVLEWQVKDKTNLLTYHKTLLDLATKEKEEILKEKEDLKAKLEKFENSSKNLTKLLESQISPKVKIVLGYGKEETVYDVSKSDVSETVFDSSTSDKENSQTYDRFKKVEGFHAVPPPLSGNFINLMKYLLKHQRKLSKLLFLSKIGTLTVKMKASLA